MKKIALFIITIMAFSISKANYNSVKVNFNTVIAADEFKKIKSSELPPAVVEEILKQYPTSKLRQAYKNNKDTYKLIMVLSSGTARTVYIDSYGRWIQKKK
ncbi:hypothetical protein [uncultured Croceitalea sp.]|uniref:hypothetical protein n=1 Tax=uncultured Croceitalea sp. TaxID=1798908 RepID=UPI0033057B73